MPRIRKYESDRDRSDRSTTTPSSNVNQKYTILQFLSAQDRPVSPLEIAQETFLKPSSVRGRLSELRKKGLVRWEYHGAYSSEPTYGMGLLGRTPPRIQNLRVSARGVKVRYSDVSVVSVGDVVVRVSFGVKRGIISYTIKAPLGLDLYSLRFCHWIATTEAEKRGYIDLLWEPKNYEFLTDYGGLKLEGVSIVTFDDLLGHVEKYYNRPGLRREVRCSSKSLSLRELETLLYGGIEQYQRLGMYNDLSKEIADLVAAQKWGNAKIASLDRKVQALLERYIEARGDE